MNHLARPLVQGGTVFGRYTVTPVDRLLYLALEDKDHRLQDRLQDMAHEFSAAAEPDACIFQLAPGFSITDKSMWQWLETTLVTEKRELLVLDTYQKATPGIRNAGKKAIWKGRGGAWTQ